MSLQGTASGEKRFYHASSWRESASITSHRRWHHFRRCFSAHHFPGRFSGHHFRFGGRWAVDGQRGFHQRSAFSGFFVFPAGPCSTQRSAFSGSFPAKRAMRPGVIFASLASRHVLSRHCDLGRSCSALRLMFYTRVCFAYVKIRILTRSVSE